MRSEVFWSSRDAMTRPEPPKPRSSDVCRNLRQGLGGDLSGKGRLSANRGEVRSRAVGLRTKEVAAEQRNQGVMRVLVIRHAETGPELESCDDPPLSAAGRRQAALLAQSLRGQELGRVVSSSMQRAVQTARPLAEALKAPLMLEPDLREIRMGELAPWGDEEQEEWRRLVAQWQAGLRHLGPAGGESMNDLVDRVEPVVARLVADPAVSGIAVVAHGVVNNVILPLLCPDLRPVLRYELEQDNTGIWELEGGGREFRVVARNDTSHLRARAKVTSRPDGRRRRRQGG